jgi:hypothetical protein
MVNMVSSICVEINYKYYLTEHIHDILNQENETRPTVYSEEQVTLTKLYFFDQETSF